MTESTENKNAAITGNIHDFFLIAVIFLISDVQIALEGSELYCYNTEGEINSVLIQASCRMHVTCIYTIINEK